MPAEKTFIAQLYNDSGVNPEEGCRLLARAPNGTLYAVISTRSGAVPRWAKVHLAQSIDDGVTWSVSEIINEVAPAGATFPYFPYAVLVVRANNSPVVVFQKTVYIDSTRESYLSYWENGIVTDIDSAPASGISYAAVNSEDKLCVAYSKGGSRFRIIEDSINELLPLGGALGVGNAKFCIDQNNTYHFFAGRGIVYNTDWRLSHWTRTAGGTWSGPEDIWAVTDYIDRVSCSCFDSTHLAVWAVKYGPELRLYIYYDGAWHYIDGAHPENGSKWASLAYDNQGNLLAFDGYLTNEFKYRTPAGTIVTAATLYSNILNWLMGARYPSSNFPTKFEFFSLGARSIGGFLYDWYFEWIRLLPTPGGGSIAAKLRAIGAI